MGFHHHYWDWRFSPSSAYQISNWIKICLPLSYSLFIIVLIIAWISLRTTSRPRMWSKTACRKGSVSRINFNLSRCHNKTRDSSQARMLTYIKHQISNSTFVSSWWEKRNYLEEIVRWNAKPFGWVEKLHGVKDVKCPSIFNYQHATVIKTNR